MRRIGIIGGMANEQKEMELSGAASALKYLENSVTRAQRRLDEAHETLDQALLNQREKPDELDGEDYEISIARARAESNDAEMSLLRLSKSLLDFDKNVDTNRRDVSEKITKAEASRFFAAFAICMRGGLEQAIIRISQDAMELRSPQDVFRIISPMMRECFAGALGSACGDEQIPPWIREVVEGAI